MRAALLAVWVVSLFACSAKASSVGQMRFWTAWMYLGEATLTAEQPDSVRIEAKPYLRTFSDLQIRVRKHAVQLRRVRIHFGDDTTQDVRFEYRIPARGTSRTIDLENGDRSIRGIELWYDRPPSGEPPVLQVYGRG